MFSVGNYYNYVANMKKSTDDPLTYAYIIFVITIVYILCIIGRSLFFAVANLKESVRICHFVNKIMVYNHISFYDRHQIIQHTPD